MTSKQESTQRSQEWIGAFAAEPARATAGKGCSEPPAEVNGCLPNEAVAAEAAAHAVVQAIGRALAGQEQISLKEDVDNTQPLQGLLAGSEASSESLAHAVDLSDVRLEKVLRLRRAIASGQYRVSAADVADKLIDAFTRGGEPHARG
jgi:anti-sigma28 factor (negative regulator of flagellin synthesis)